MQPPQGLLPWKERQRCERVPDSSSLGGAIVFPAPTVSRSEDAEISSKPALEPLL
jgi:hypothetical protein